MKQHIVFQIFLLFVATATGSTVSAESGQQRGMTGLANVSPVLQQSLENAPVIGEEQENCHIKVIKPVDNTNDGKNDNEDDKMVGPCRLSDFEAHKMFGANATAEAIQHDIVSPFGIDANMHAAADDRINESAPLSNPDSVSLVTIKCIHMLATIDWLDLSGPSMARLLLCLIDSS